MRPTIIPNDLTGKILYDFCVKNESLIFHAKKNQNKIGDSCFSNIYINEKGQFISKSESIVQQNGDPNKLKITAVINTTNWFDSHWDVHIQFIWKKSLNDNKSEGFYLLQEHESCFENVIARNCNGYTKKILWKDLGVNISGETEALLFDCIIEKDTNEFMFEQYKKGYVKNHSVGMRYVKMVTCINDDDYPVQKENWDKYFPMVANQDDAMVEGIFWAILEAKIIEGSAVLFGSNTQTPTLEMIEITDDSTTDEPQFGTQKQPQFDLVKAIKETKFI